MKRCTLLLASFVTAAVSGVPARTVFMPPLHAWTDSRTAPGGCVSSDGSTNVILQNLSDIPQTVTIRIEGEEMVTVVRRDSSPGGAWKNIFSKTFMDRSTSTQAVNVKQVTLAKKGDTAGNDNVRFGFSSCCRWHTAGLSCIPGWHCDGEQILPVHAALTHYSVGLLTIEVEEKNGAIQGAVAVTADMACAGASEVSKTLTPINGGKPF